MTSPVGGEHVSRYRAIAEFDNLIREADKAKRALRELREEQAKLNAESVEGDKKAAASKAQRAKAESDASASAKKATEDLGKNKDIADKAGQDTGAAYSKGMGKKIEQDSKNGSNQQFLAAATNALKDAFAKAGDDSGKGFVLSTKNRIGKDSADLGNDNSPIISALKKTKDKANLVGLDTGNAYVQGIATKLKTLNGTLGVLGFDKLNLDVDIKDAEQSIKAVQFELTQLSHETANPQVRIDTNSALTQLRALEKLFKDEVAESIVKDSERIKDELEKIDSLPSGKSFKFWALTALSDMAKVFEEAEKGTTVFEKLRAAAAGGGGGGNFVKSFISGFDDFSESSSNLLQKLGRVSGELYRMPGLIGVIVAAVPALIAGIGALGGGALGLASALGSLTGFLAAGPPLIIAFGSAILGLKSAFGGISEVLKNAKQAQEQEAEAKEQSRLGTTKALTAAQKYKVALDQLEPSSRKVTEAFVDFSQKYAGLQKVVAEDFFKEVVKDTGDLDKLLPSLEKLLGSSATALGKVADQGLKMITSGPWTKDFSTISKNNGKLIENMGGAGLALANVFRNIAVAAGPFATWVTKSIKDAATAFSDWSTQARSDGTITKFLGQTQTAAQSLWVIIKNLSSVVNSFFQSTVDEGQSYLKTLGDITGHWSDVAKAQESANSPLREWMTNLRPVLSALGGLIGDLARGIGGLASNQNNLKTMITLLDTLRTAVLPPILEILQHLNDSGITATVTKALGSMLDAISHFLDSGATSALTVFVTVLSNFAELLFNIASLPGISNILGGLASGLAALAAVSIVARFTGLFKIWDFFTWMIRNKGNLSGAFADAARGAAGLSTSGVTSVPKSIPSSIAQGTTVSTNVIGSEALSNAARAEEEVGKSASNSASKVGLFSRALSGISSAGNTAKGALGGIVGFLGGPWGVALVAATTVIGLVSSKLAQQKQDADDTRTAFLSLKNAYGDIAEGNTDQISQLAETDDKLKGVIAQAQAYGLSLKDVSGALGNQGQSLSRVNEQLDLQINNLKAIPKQAADNVTAQGIQAGINNAIVAGQLKAAEAYKKQINEVAGAQKENSAIVADAINKGRNYQQRLAGLTQAQVDSSVAVGENSAKINTLSNALDTMSSATATAKDRSNALNDIINAQNGTFIDANEAAESFSGKLLALSDAAKTNGRSLSTNSEAGLRNRDALEDAAKATRDLFLQDIASGKPMDEALKRHKDRIKELQNEADKAFGTKKQTRDLINAYGDVPDDVKTSITTTGYAKVYQQMIDLKSLQASLSEGKSLSEATKEVEQSKARAAAHGYGDGYGMNSAAPGYATGGPVWGAGTKTSDSIQAWLSNGEFVQPTDAVDHYGINIMEALRTKRLDKDLIAEALPDDQSTGKFATGGHAKRFATGGAVSWPFPVDNSNTMIKKSWANDIGGLGGGAGGNGWKWQAAVLHAAFPGLSIISGYRPGARTLSGNRSYHSIGRAVDLPPRRDVAQWIRSHYGAKTKELITPWQDLNIWNGKPHHYSGEVYAQHAGTGRFRGNAHDHWAFRDGGLVDLMKMMGIDNLSSVSSPQSALPTSPRTLSNAASNVVNNTTESTRTFGDVIINNPTPERGGDSIRDALYRTQLLYG